MPRVAGGDELIADVRRGGGAATRSVFTMELEVADTMPVVVATRLGTRDGTMLVTAAADGTLDRTLGITGSFRRRPLIPLTPRGDDGKLLATEGASSDDAEWNALRVPSKVSLLQLAGAVIGTKVVEGAAPLAAESETGVLRVFQRGPGSAKADGPRRIRRGPVGGGQEAAERASQIHARNHLRRCHSLRCRSRRWRRRPHR